MPSASLVLAALVLAAPPGPRPLDAKERAGRLLYHEGKGPSGAGVNALVAGARLSAQQVSCAGCHGDDGMGRPEGGVRPTPITWPELTKPWGRTLESGRSHPPYDARTFARAVAEGLDPAGNRLDPIMPRYSMARADAEALLAYVKRLGNEPVPGIGPAEVRIGTVVPASGSFAALGRAQRGVLEAWVAEVNAAGGIHGRRLALHVASYDPAKEGGDASARRLLARRDLLALVSGFTPAAEPALADLAEHEGVPLVGPFTPWPGDAAARQNVFYLLGGAREQARVLAGHAARTGGTGTAVVVHASEERHADAAAAGAERLRRAGWKVEVVPFARGGLDAARVDELRARGGDWVLFVGEDDDLAALLREAAASAWTPHVLVAGALAGRAALGAPAAFQGRIVLAMPSAPADETPAGREALARASSRAGTEGFRAARASAWAAGQVLGEGLRRAGRGVSRQRLAASLEALSGFETGLLPPLSYGPARRIGAAGAWLVTADVDAQAFHPLGSFVPVD